MAHGTLPESVRLVVFLAWTLGMCTALAAEDVPPRPVDFNRDIRPILSDNCFFCHGPDPKHREADLRLDTREGLFEDRGEYAVVDTEKPAQSELLRRILSNQKDERMPPPKSRKSLDAGQVDLIRRWIEQGAAWQPHWAYVPATRHPLPEVRDTAWPANWIDQFVLARLEHEGLRPAPPADRVTLIRRLSFDLTGLPPTPEEADQFLADNRPDAYQRLVDRLLDSERFGERMAMYWLDLVRYADTVGYHGDQVHAITPYRDWVIDAFNQNRPFDQFTREQIAGDLLAGQKENAPGDDEITDLKIASGYHRLLQTSHEGGVQKKEYLAMYQADRIRNLSAVWLAATMGCCQCHDHKYDPFTTADFYSMGALLADIDDAKTFSGTNSNPTRRDPELDVLTPLDRHRIQKLDQQIATESEPARLAELNSQRAAIKPRRTMITAAVQPREIRLLPRGNWLDESGPVMPPAVPKFLGSLSSGAQRAGRLQLARWLVDPDDEHGVGRITARVQVNRLGDLMFGRGIAPVLDDFGAQGRPPEHPRLLDNLAVEFVERGWDVKQMLRLLAASSAYRQSSVASPALRLRDPENRLVARQSSWRLPAETIRDNALAISGLLVLDYGGDSVRPYQPAGYYRHLNFPQRKYQHDKDRRQWRRGVYVHWQRQFLHPALKALDAPSREECTAQRPRSNTPLAALVLLNDPTFVEAARLFAQRIVIDGGSDDAQRLDFAFRQAVSRTPDAYERTLLLEILKTDRQRYQADRDAAVALHHIGQAAVAEDQDPVELAAWTGVARAILNLNETITRN